VKPGEPTGIAGSYSARVFSAAAGRRQFSQQPIDIRHPQIDHKGFIGGGNARCRP
jgi:hypothetical protein